MLSKLSCSNYIPSGVRLLRVSSFTIVVSGKDISQMEIRRIVCVLPNSKNSLMWKQLLKKYGELPIARCVIEELDNQLSGGVLIWIPAKNSSLDSLVFTAFSNFMVP